nr:fatty acid desaturase [Leadbetterella sp.]
MQKIKFVNKTQATFFTSLRTRVDEYFQENNLQKSGGNDLILKAAIMLSLYFIPYFMVLFGGFTTAINILLLILMGIGIAGTGMSVMHDAIHGTFSDKKWVNKLFGASIYFLGGNAYNWEMQHNTLHHTYTNILDMDED